MNSSTVKKRLGRVGLITGRRPGRPSDPDKLIFVTVGLRRSQWEWLSLWFPSKSPTDQIGALFDRAMKFWPCGPFVFGHVRKSTTISSVTSVRIGSPDSEKTTICCGGGVL